MKKWIVLKAVYDEGCIRDIDFWKFDDRKKAVAFVAGEYRHVKMANDLTEDTCNKYRRSGKVTGACCQTCDGTFQVEWLIEEDK